MAGYVIVDVEVLEPVEYQTYRAMVPGTLEPYGGRFVVRGGDFEVLEGEWQPKRIVVLEFPSIEQARAWYVSEEYREAKALRQRLTRSSVVMISGV